MEEEAFVIGEEQPGESSHGHSDTDTQDEGGSGRSVKGVVTRSRARRQVTKKKSESMELQELKSVVRQLQIEVMGLKTEAKEMKKSRAKEIHESKAVSESFTAELLQVKEKVEAYGRRIERIDQQNGEAWNDLKEEVTDDVGALRRQLKMDLTRLEGRVINAERQRSISENTGSSQASLNSRPASPTRPLRQSKLRDEKRKLAMVKLPTYDGRSEVAGFIKQAKNLRNLQEWTDAEFALQLTAAMNDQARLVFRYLSEDEMTSGEAIVEALSKRFELRQSKTAAKAELRGKVIGRGESFDSFSLELVHLVRVAYPDADLNTCKEIELEHFLDGMTDVELRYELAKLEMKTVEEAAAKARELMQCIRARRQSRVCQDIHVRSEDHGSRRENNEKNPHFNGTSARNVRRDKQCEYCGRKGHGGEECWHATGTDCAKNANDRA